MSLKHVIFFIIEYGLTTVSSRPLASLLNLLAFHINPHRIMLIYISFISLSGKLLNLCQFLSVSSSNTVTDRQNVIRIRLLITTHSVETWTAGTVWYPTITLLWRLLINEGWQGGGADFSRSLCCFPIQEQHNVRLAISDWKSRAWVILLYNRSFSDIGNIS